MIRLLLLLILFFLAYTFFTVLLRALPRGRSAGLPPEKSKRGEEMVRDTQCGTYIPRSQALEKSIRGEKYFFCSAECRDAFRADD
ncbi:MAG: PP0621 family protein [Desulfuromonadales bacterium]